MSQERIQCLRGSEDPNPGDLLTPSHDNIVRVLYSLISNQEIDAGIIFLSTSLGMVPATTAKHFLKPKYDTKSCPVEAVCPLNRDTLDTRGRYVPDIRDRELDALFTEISRVKGRKITFIADSCYASSFPRHPRQKCAAYTTLLVLMSTICRALDTKNWNTFLAINLYYRMIGSHIGVLTDVWRHVETTRLRGRLWKAGIQDTSSCFEVGRLEKETSSLTPQALRIRLRCLDPVVCKCVVKAFSSIFQFFRGAEDPAMTWKSPWVCISSHLI